MRLNFKKISLHNFMSFADETFDFNDYQGLTLVKGKNNDIPGSRNGVGKSVTFEAVLFALFGQLQEKIKNENIVNRYSSSKDMLLELEFSADDCDYKISRGLQKGKMSFFNLFRVEGENDIDITKSSIAETQDYLENEIIHCDISIFLRTVLLTADQTYNFYKLKKADKKDFVEKLFDISAFGDMHTLIHKDVLALDKDITARQNRLLVLNQNISDYESRIIAYDTKRKTELVQLNESLAVSAKEYDALKTKTVDVNSEEVEKYTKAIKALDDAISKNDAASKKLEKEKNTVVLEINKLLSSCESKTSMISKHAELSEKLCDDCRPIFDSYYSLDVMKSDIADMKSSISGLEPKKVELVDKIAAITKKTTEFKTKRTKAFSKITELTAESTQLAKEISRVESHMSSLKNDIAKRENDANPYVEMLEEGKTTLKSETDALKKIETKYNYLKFAENIVSQETLRKLIIKDLIVLLNNRVKTYLTKLGAKYYVKFDEDMEYEFITEGGTCEFGNFSAGERMRTMIATSFAFRDFMSIRNGLNSNILVLDEYFDSAIDSLCVSSILSILKDYNSAMNQNIFVISHRTEVSDDEFANIMQVEKTNNISKISKMK